MPERRVVDSLDLDHAAHRHLLGERVAFGRQRRVVVNPAGEHWRQRHDDPLSGRFPAVECDRDAGFVLADRPHRRAQSHDIVSQFLRQALAEGAAQVEELVAQCVPTETTTDVTTDTEPTDTETTETTDTEPTDTETTETTDTEPTETEPPETTETTPTEPPEITQTTPPAPPPGVSGL